MGTILARWMLALVAQPAFSQGAGVWDRRAPYPVASTEVSGSAIDGFVYTVCGLTPQGSSNRRCRYHPPSETWVERAALPIQGGADHYNVAAAGGGQRRDTSHRSSRVLLLTLAAITGRSDVFIGSAQ